MARVGRLLVLSVVCAIALAAPAGAQLPLPPPPSLPPPRVPAPAEPLLAVAGPTVGPLCGTASLLTLLTPSLAEGYLKLPFSSLVDSPTFRSYANTALYVCGFIPFPLTPTQCAADQAMLDALRGLNPLAAQVVGLSPEGAVVDTVLAIERLLPSGPSVAADLADELSLLMHCTRSAGPPATPTNRGEGAMPPIEALRPAGPTSGPLLPLPVPAVPIAVGASPVTPAPSSTPGAARPAAFGTRLVPRSGTQWAGVLAGIVLLVGSGSGWLAGRRRRASTAPASRD